MFIAKQIRIHLIRPYGQIEWNTVLWLDVEKISTFGFLKSRTWIPENPLFTTRTGFLLFTTNKRLYEGINNLKEWICVKIFLYCRSSKFLLTQTLSFWAFWNRSGTKISSCWILFIIFSLVKLLQIF
jgi:hypothetical protein